MLLAATQTRPPSTPSPAGRTPEKRSFVSHDGTAIFYRHWTSRQLRPAGAVVLLHREHEHSGRLAHIVDELGLADFAFYAWDARGHGCSPGIRGDAPSFGTLIKDLDAFVRHVERHCGLSASRLHVVAQGASGIIAAAWAHDYAPRIASLVLAAPAFECRGLAAMAPGALQSLSRRRGSSALRTYARPEDLTQDLARRESYRNDPLVGTTTTARLLASMNEASKRIIADAGRIRVPVQLLIAGEDRLVRRRPQLSFFNALCATDKEFHTFDGFYHDLLGERDRHRVLEKVGQFLRRHAMGNRLDDPAHSLGAVQSSAVRPSGIETSIDSLRRAASRTSLRAFGPASVGIGLAMKSGLDSSAVVEHVCRNVPAGASTLGRYLDGRFLASLPAKALRARATNLERAIRTASERIRATGLPVRIVDLAAGDGHHVMDAIHKLAILPESVLLCESDEERVTEATRFAHERNLGGILRIVRAHRHDEQWIASLAPHTTIAIAPLQELASDPPRTVQTVLGGLARAIPPGGCMIHSTGPHHPEWHRHAAALMPISENSADRAGTALCQADLDRCIESAGFNLHDRWVDEWGVFSVSLCIRAGSEAMMRGLVSR